VGDGGECEMQEGDRERIGEKKCYASPGSLHTTACERIGIVDQRLNGQENSADMDKLFGRVSLLL
jgi:hypothetical protein